MATVTNLARHLQLQFQNGTAANGKVKVKNQSYAHVSSTAADDDILAVGQALAGLSSETLVGIARLDQDGLTASTTSSGGTTTTGSGTSTGGTGSTSSGSTSGTSTGTTTTGA